MSMCRVFSCVVGRGCLLRSVRSLGKTLLVFALLHSTFQAQICLLLQVFLDFLLLHSSPLKCKRHLLGVLVLKCLVGIDLDYCDIEWVALEMNRDHSVVFEIASKYCISDSFICTTFWTLLLTMMATPFLLRDSCPQ